MDQWRKLAVLALLLTSALTYGESSGIHGPSSSARRRSAPGGSSSFGGGSSDACTLGRPGFGLPSGLAAPPANPPAPAYPYASAPYLSGPVGMPSPIAPPQASAPKSKEKSGKSPVCPEKCEAKFNPVHCEADVFDTFDSYATRKVDAKNECEAKIQMCQSMVSFTNTGRQVNPPLKLDKFKCTALAKPEFLEDLKHNAPWDSPEIYKDLKRREGKGSYGGKLVRQGDNLVIEGSFERFVLDVSKLSEAKKKEIEKLIGRGSPRGEDEQVVARGTLHYYRDENGEVTKGVYRIEVEDASIMVP